MVNGRSSTPPHRTQRALSMAAETRKARDTFNVSPEYPYTQPTFPPGLSTAHTLAYPLQQLPVSPHPTPGSFFDAEQFQRTTSSGGNQKKDARDAQQQRREQIVLMLQHQQIEAQEKARQEKLDKQQAMQERKQRSEFKQIYQAQYDSNSGQRESRGSRQQLSLPIHPYGYEPSSPHMTDAGSSHQDQRSDHDSLTSLSSSTTSYSSRDAPDRPRTLSLKSNTKSMYDLRPWSGGPQSPSYEYRIGHESDENSSAKSVGWDSLMDTLHSPTFSSPSDVASWDSRDEPDLDLMDSMSSLTFSHDTSGNGNGRYLLVFGANGRTGIELVKQGLERNYRVTAFVRDDKLLLEDISLRKNQNLLIVRGSPTSQADVDGCVEGQDVVVNVIGARLMAHDATIGSHAQVVLNNALKKHGVRRLIVVTSYGCLGLRNYLINTKRLFSRVFMTGILKDKVLQEDIIQRDGQYLDWTIVRPITLKDGDLSGKYLVHSEELPTANKIKILTRKDLAHYILTIINRPQDYKAIRSIAGKPSQRK